MKKVKKTFTLLEIMIVIFLIGLIGSVIGYNMKGSLDEGKAFKTKQARIRIKELLDLEIARGADPQTVIEKPGSFLRAAGVVKDAQKMLYDGWGEKFIIDLDQDGGVRVYSKKYDTYIHSKTALRGKNVDDDE